MRSGKRTKNAGQGLDQAFSGWKEAREGFRDVTWWGQNSAWGQRWDKLCTEQRETEGAEEPTGLASLQGRLHALLFGQRVHRCAEGTCEIRVIVREMCTDGFLYHKYNTKPLYFMTITMFLSHRCRTTYWLRPSQDRGSTTVRSWLTRVQRKSAPTSSERSFWSVCLRKCPIQWHRWLMDHFCTLSHTWRRADSWLTCSSHLAAPSLRLILSPSYWLSTYMLMCALMQHPPASTLLFVCTLGAIL